MAVITMFWDVTLCGSAEVRRNFRGKKAYCRSQFRTGVFFGLLFDPEDGCSTILLYAIKRRYIGLYRQDVAMVL
jgi:hypothetical protein